MLVKRTCCTSRGFGFNSQDLHDDSQSAITPVLRVHLVVSMVTWHIYCAPITKSYFTKYSDYFMEMSEAVCHMGTKI